MKILHLEASSGWGGQEIRILSEAKEMRLRGHEIILGVMKQGRLIQAARKANFTVYPLNFHKLHWPLCLINLLKLIKNHKIDLINTHSSLDAWIGGIASRIARRPVVRTRHLSTPIKCGKNSVILYEKLADFIVTTCADIIPMICAQSGKKTEQCRSIPTGVDPSSIVYTDQEAKNIRAKMGILKNDFLVGTACFLRSWKGISIFLEAANRLRHVSDLKWLIIGGGHIETYQKIALDLGLHQIVYFTGHLANPFPAIQALDLFALLSTANEGVSQAILQAAYLKKPLIATPVGGLKEVCLHEITGLQVDPFNADQVIQGVLKLKEDAFLREKMGLKGRELVESHFMLKKTIDQMEEIYYQLLYSKTELRAWGI